MSDRQFLACSLLLIVLGYLLRGAIGGRMRRNPKHHHAADARHCWVEIAGVWHAFTDEALAAARARADTLSPWFRRRWMSSALIIAAALALLWMLAGCSSRSGHIKSGDVSVRGAPDAGEPATLATTQEDEVIPIPAGSEIVVTEIDAVAAQPATDSTPAVEAVPAAKETVVRFSGTSHWKRSKAAVRADTGTIDTSIAKHRIAVEDRSKLLWVAIGCGIAGLVVKSMLPGWPAISNGLLLASPCAFAAWKFAEVPGWLWALVVAAVVLLALGYKRAEWDKDGDGIPDFLKPPRPPSS